MKAGCKNRAVSERGNIPTSYKLTIIPRACVEYEMVDSQEARRAELAITDLISNKRE